MLAPSSGLPRRRAPETSRASASSEIVDCSPPRSRTARAASDSRSPYTTTNGTFSSSASRMRLPSVSSRSSTSTRKPSASRRSAERLGGVAMALPDRDHAHLHRREPERERAAVVLDEDPEEALERPAGARGGSRPARARGCRAPCTSARTAPASGSRAGSSPSASSGRARRSCAGRSWGRRTSPHRRRSRSRDRDASSAASSAASA